MNITNYDPNVNTGSLNKQATGMSLRSDEENQQNKEIYSSEQIGDTPFNVITNTVTDEKFIAFGNYKMPQKYDVWEYIEKIKNKEWSVIMDIIVIFIDIATKKNLIK